MNPNPEQDVGPRRAFPGPNSPRTPSYKFTEEEIRVIRECNAESFYRRCLPYAAVLGGGAYLAVRNGYLRPNPRWGPTPKVALGIVVGYFIGKFSYQKKCAEKLMQLPDSQLGEMLRQKRRRGGGRFQDTIDSLAPFGSVKESDIYTDLNPNNSLDLDTSRPDNPGLDDYQRPSVDNPSSLDEEEMPPEQKHTTTYDELRRRNRDEYQQKRIGNWREPQKAADAPTLSELDDNTTPQPQQQPKNKYGDIWG